MTTVRDELRSLPAITGTPPPFDPSTAPSRPRDLFLSWLREAIADHPEAHACTLSTISTDGPDARVLILKDVTDPLGFEIATSSESPKAKQLGQDNRCALSFHWIPLARCVRIRGRAVRASEQECGADFEGRSEDAKAVARVGKQSCVVGEGEDVAQEIGAAKERGREGSEVGWDVWRVIPDSIEFWQGEKSRRHVRVRYRFKEGVWVKELLWP